MNITHCSWHIDHQTGTWPYNFVDGQEAALLPATLKRRLTPLGRQAITLLYQVSSQMTEEITWVVASRRTDISRKIRLLTSLAQQEPLSPTDFSMSVHNAIIGAFSIATHNIRLHTAVAGSEHSFATGLLEAFSLQMTTSSPVGYLYYDALVPYQLEEVEDIDYPIACLAMLLSPYKQHDTSASVLSLRYNTDPQTTISPHNIVALINHLQHGTTPYRIPLPGGSFLLEHCPPQR